MPLSIIVGFKKCG